MCLHCVKINKLHMEANTAKIILMLGSVKQKDKSIHYNYNISTINIF